jgi:hypothetical protein
LYGLEHQIVEISGDVTDAGQTNERTNEQKLKIELLSQWKLEAEFRNSTHTLHWMQINATRTTCATQRNPTMQLIPLSLF